MRKNNLDIILIYSHESFSTYGLWATGVKPFLWHYFYVTLTSSGFLEISYLCEDLEKRTTEKVSSISEYEADLEMKKFLLPYKKIGLIGPAPFSHFSTIKRSLIYIDNEIEHLISEKSGEEIKKISNSGKITKNGLNKLSKFIKPGITGKELATKLKLDFLSQAEELSFPIAVTTSSNIKDTTVSNPSNRKLKNKDIVCIDCGVVKDGFHSDCTRMFFVNYPEAERDYKKLLLAHKNVIKSLYSGMKIVEIVDKYHIELDKLDLNSKTLQVEDLGHSIGFFVHEPPFIYAEKYKDYKIKDNMIFTLEPEIIMPDYRLRVEDMILMKNGKAKIIT